MPKIQHDKYYTPENLSKQLISTTFSIIGSENITEIIEPSAGNGSFSNLIPDCIAYDIEPESEGIIKKDYLELSLPYKKGRLIIGNPPFGDRMSIAQKFYKHSITFSDYIAFILPISQLNNTRSLFEFDLIYSEDLGKQNYSDRNLHCCFNIYKRNPSGLNKRKTSKLNAVTIVRQDSKRYPLIANHSVRMCYWGNSSAGKILTPEEHYSAEYKIIVNNKEFEKDIIHTLETVNWNDRINNVSMLKIQQFHIVELLKEKIPLID